VANRMTGDTGNGGETWGKGKTNRLSAIGKKKETTNDSRQDSDDQVKSSGRLNYFRIRDKEKEVWPQYRPLGSVV